MLIFTILIRKFILPKSKDPDQARTEFILNILLASSMILALVAFVENSRDFLTESFSSIATNAVSPYITFSSFVFFCLLLLLSRRGKITLSSSILIIFFLLASFYTSWRWGIDIPQALLIYALIIVMSGILIGTRGILFMTTLIGITLLGLTYSQEYHLYQTSVNWRMSSPTIGDSIVLVTNLVAIALVCWLFNREMERALLRARYSEAVLKRQKDRLEEIVADRTKKLKQVQVEKLMQLYRFAEFGRLSSGLFHELVTPLNLISLNLQQVKDSNIDPGLREKFDKSLERALLGTARIERYLNAARKQIQTQDVCEEFSVNEEIVSVMQMLEYRAKKEKIKIILRARKKVKLFGNPLKLNQLVTNLVANGIDAYDDLADKKAKQIEIVLKKNKAKAVISVEDWGCGIDEIDLPKIFEPLFTTKSLEKGTGIGLSVSREIIKNYFKGSIKVKSKKGVGSTFTISFSLSKAPVYRLKKEKS